jgi:hypothetical protein
MDERLRVALYTVSEGSEPHSLKHGRDGRFGVFQPHFQETLLSARARAGSYGQSPKQRLSSGLRVLKIGQMSRVKLEFSDNEPYSTTFGQARHTIPQSVVVGLH